MQVYIDQLAFFFFILSLFLFINHTLSTVHFFFFLYTKPSLHFDFLFSLSSLFSLLSRPPFFSPFFLISCIISSAYIPPHPLHTRPFSLSLAFLGVFFTIKIK
ncbi:hypothetical protein BDF14DRAFT_740444 [Spinellus fusiger]|nr:hypothetical protein BDF14DRAFT_740444 [Spinellus fusiger]